MRERRGGPRLGQLEPGRGRGGGSEDAQGRGRMPALVIVMRMDDAAEPALRLEPDDIRVDQCPARDIEQLAESDDDRHDRNRRMPSHRLRHVVVVDRMRGGAVQQCRIEHANPAAVSEDQRGARGIAIDQRRAKDGDRRLGGAGERDADRVGDGEHRHPDPRLGRSLDPDRGQAGCERRCERLIAHDQPRSVARLHGLEAVAAGPGRKPAADRA